MQICEVVSQEISALGYVEINRFYSPEFRLQKKQMKNANAVPQDKLWNHALLCEPLGGRRVNIS